MNASEQAPRAPFGFGDAGRELAANDKTFGFESQQRSFNLQLVQTGGN